jgi:cytochrome c5
MNRRLILIMAMTIGGCASSPTPLPDAQSDAARLYSEKCGVCHSVPHPRRNNMAQWRHLLDIMKLRMQEKGMQTLSANDEQVILDYLERHARK